MLQNLRFLFYRILIEKHSSEERRVDRESFIAFSWANIYTQHCTDNEYISINYSNVILEIAFEFNSRISREKFFNGQMFQELRLLTLSTSINSI